MTGGVSDSAVEYHAGGQAFTVMFDRATGLPTRIRTLDYDNVWGNVTRVLALSTWQAIGHRSQGAEVEGVVAPINR